MNDLVKIGYDSKTKQYILKSPGGYGTSNMCINGKPISDPLKGVRNGELITINEKPEIITYDVIGRVVLGYEDEVSGEKLSSEEYNKQLVEINKLRKWDEEKEEDVFNSIEDEVRVLSFFRRWKKLYQNTTITKTLDFEIINYPISEYEDIVPLYSIDAKNVFEARCTFTPNLVQVFRDECKSREIELKDIDIPNHSGLKFAKIKGQYISGMEEYSNTMGRKIMGSYEECIERRNLIVSRLKEIIDLHMKKQSQNILNKSTVGHALTQLSSIKSSVGDLNVKVKDIPLQNSIVNKVDDLIKTYLKLT